MKTNNSNDTMTLVSSFIKASVKLNGMGAKVSMSKALANKDFKIGTKNNRTPVFALIEKGIVEEKNYDNVTLGRSYEGAVNNRSESEEQFVSEPMKGRNWVKGLENLIEVNATDNSKFYLRITLNKNTKTDTAYFIGGKEATSEEIAILKAYRTKSNATYNRQHEAGVVEGNEVQVRTISLDNLASIQYGERKLNLK